MIKSELRDYIARVVEAGAISAEDVRQLQRRVLPDGLASRAEAEALLSLDRAVPTDAAWRGVVTALVVDFVVWGARPTGKVMGEDARWLAAVLDGGPRTSTTTEIAEAVLEQADQVDEALVHLVLRGRREAMRTLAA